MSWKALEAKCGHRVVRWCPSTTESERNRFIKEVGNSPCYACLEKAVLRKRREEKRLTKWAAGDTPESK